MAKNSCMALCCQNQVSKATGQRYGLLSSTSISGHSASVTVLGLLKKEEEEEELGGERISTKRCFSRFQVRHLKHSNCSYKWLQQKRACSHMLPGYLFLRVPIYREVWAVLHVIHWLRRPFYFWVIPTYQPTSVVGNNTHWFCPYDLSGTTGTTFAKSCWCVYEVADVTCVVVGMHLFAIVFYSANWIKSLLFLQAFRTSFFKCFHLHHSMK